MGMIREAIRGRASSKLRMKVGSFTVASADADTAWNFLANALHSI